VPGFLPLPPRPEPQPATPPRVTAGASTMVPLSSATPTAQPQTVTWWVDARKPRGNDKQAVSPTFEVSSGDSLLSVSSDEDEHAKRLLEQTVTRDRCESREDWRRAHTSTSATSSEEWSTVPVFPLLLPAAAQPQTLIGGFCEDNCCFRTLWWVEARKLRANEKQAVSPTFEVSLRDSLPSVKFKMMIHATVMSDQKGGASFRKSKGSGLVQLKCEADELSKAAADFKFRISIGTGESFQAPRGPKAHNFLAGAVCGLDKDEEEWHFQSAVGPDSMTFVLCLDIARGAQSENAVS